MMEPSGATAAYLSSRGLKSEGSSPGPYSAPNDTSTSCPSTMWSGWPGFAGSLLHGLHDIQAAVVDGHHVVDLPAGERLLVHEREVRGDDRHPEACRSTRTTRVEPRPTETSRGRFSAPLATAATCYFTLSDIPGRYRQIGGFRRVDLSASGSSAFQVWRRRSTCSACGSALPSGTPARRPRRHW